MLWGSSPALDRRPFHADGRASAQPEPTMDAPCETYFRKGRPTASSVATRGRTASRRPYRGRSVAPEKPYELALNTYAVRWQNPDLIRRVGRLECNRCTATAKTLERCLLIVDEGDDNVTGIGGFGFADQCDVAIKYARFDHAVATDFQPEMLSGRTKTRRQA